MLKPFIIIVVGVLWLWWATPTYDSMYIPWKLAAELAAIVIGLTFILGGMIAAENETR